MMTLPRLYKLVDDIKAACKNNDDMELYKQFDNALHISQSVLEIIGSIATVLKEQRPIVNRLLGESRNQEIDEALEFVAEAYTTLGGKP